MSEGKSARSHSYWAAGGELFKLSCVTSEDVRADEFDVARGSRGRRRVGIVVEGVGGGLEETGELRGRCGDEMGDGNEVRAGKATLV